MATPPDSPPDTPDPPRGPGTGPANMHGDLNYKEAKFNNSIATGHIHGYEVILATINVTVDAANKLTKNIKEFMVKVDLQLHQVSDKVVSTAGILDSINALVVKQAKKRGLTVDREVKTPKKIPHVQTDRGNVAGSRDNNDPLSMTCFQAIKERIEGTHKAFDDISEKIKKSLKTIGQLQKLHQDGQEAVTGVNVRGPGPDAQSDLRHPGTPNGKVGLSDDDRKFVLLTDEHLDWMEKKVDFHREDLFIRFTVFEFSLDHDRRDKNEEDIESIIREIESVKLIGKSIWKEIKRLAKYLRDNGEPSSPLEEFRGLRIRPPPEALRRYLPKPSRVNSLYVGWEFRKCLPLPPPHLYGRLDQPAPKLSWSFAVPQRMPFSTEEQFLRVLAQATERAKADRTLKDEYWGALKKVSQRALVDELVQAQNHHLQKDFPQLEWTIAGLETKTDPWALIAAQGRSRPQGKKMRHAITAFEVILKTQWQIDRGYGPSMPPGGIWGPTPVGSSGPGLGGGPLPDGGNGAPPDVYRPQGPWGPPGGPPIPSGGGPGGGQGVPIIVNADDGIGGGPQSMPQSMPQIPVHSQSRPRESTKSKHRPVMVLREPKWVLVREGGKKTKQSRRKNAGAHKNRQRTSKTRHYVELREPGKYYRTAAAGPSGGGRRPSSPPSPGIPQQPPLVQPLRPSPPPRPSSGFVPANSGRSRAHMPPSPPVASPPPPQTTHIHVSFAQTQSEEEEEKEAEEVVEDILAEFSELNDTNGKMNNRRRHSEWNMQVPGQRLGADAAARMADERRRIEREPRQQRQHAEPRVSIHMSLMRQVDRESSRRLAEEDAELRVRSVRLERMAESRAPPPPAFVGPGSAERTRLAQETERREIERREMERRLEMERREMERREMERRLEMERLEIQRRRGIEREREVRERRRE